MRSQLNDFYNVREPNIIKYKATHTNNRSKKMKIRKNWLLGCMKYTHKKKYNYVAWLWGSRFIFLIIFFSFAFKMQYHVKWILIFNYDPCRVFNNAEQLSCGSLRWIFSPSWILRIGLDLWFFEEWVRIFEFKFRPI